MVKTCENTGYWKQTKFGSDVPTDSYIVNFGTYRPTFMVRTTGHGVPYDASEQCKEGKEGEGKNGYV
jgi:hypothetical protein